MKSIFIFLTGFLLGTLTRVIAASLRYRRRERNELRELMREIERTERR